MGLRFGFRFGFKFGLEFEFDIRKRKYILLVIINILYYFELN